MNPLLQDRRSPDWHTGVAAGRPVVLLLHGYGSNEDDLVGLAPAIGLALPWASLRGPVELGGAAAAWFTVTAPGDPDAGPVEDATTAIWQWVDEIAGDAARVVPIGFSQGGLMATQLIRTRPDRVIAPVVLGGFVLGAVQPADDQLRIDRPPLFWGRGDADRVITSQAVARTAEFLAHHATLHERVYPQLAHGVIGEEIEDVRAFLALAVGVDAVRQP